MEDCDNVRGEGRGFLRGVCMVLYNCIHCHDFGWCKRLVMIFFIGFGAHYYHLGKACVVVVRLDLLTVVLQNDANEVLLSSI